jgi:hypothetical protein
LDSREVETVNDNDEERFEYEDEGLQEGLEGKNLPDSEQSGYTPRSGLERLGDEDVDMASTGSDASSVEDSNILKNKAPASEAGSQTPSAEAGKSG